MPTHGTALTEEQLAEFIGNGAKALALIAGKLGPQRTHYWDGKSGLMQERLLKALTPLLLDPIGTVDIPATTDPLVVRDEFAVGVNGISYIGENFKQWFLPMVESPTSATTLRYARIIEVSPDEQIMEELGDLKETNLAHVFTLIKFLKTGKPGGLLTDGYAIFFVKDINGVFRVVRVDWRDYAGGWGVDAFEVSDLFRWFGGYRVFSRDS